MSLRKLGSSVASLVVGIAGVTAAGFCLTVAQWQLNTAWNVHVERIDTDMQVKGERIGYRLQFIADNLRTIAFTPSVRRVASGEQLLTPLDFDNVKQVVAKLSSKFEGSQVYVTPSNFNATRLDPNTGALPAPAICFNCSKIQNATDSTKITFASEIQTVTQSQRQTMVEQSAWLHDQFPSRALFKGLDAPVISSGRVEAFAVAQTAKKQTENTHIVFSVPYYNHAGLYAGLVSAAIPNQSFTKIVPYGPYAIESPKSEYISTPLATANAAPSWHPSFWDSGVVDTTFASRYDITASDPRGQWSLQARYGAISFYESPEYLLIKQYAMWAVGMAALLTALGIAWVVAAHRKAKTLKHNATHDALTGLPNRVLLQNLMQLSLSDSIRKKSAATVLYLDLDKFKLVNDTLGHHVGDMVLQEAAKVIGASIRSNDVLARMGGDEFVVLMRDCADPADAMTVASRIIDNLNKPLHIDGHTINIGTSIGISVLRGENQSPDEIIRCADLALFRAKTEERGSYRFYEPDMDAERLRRRQLEMDLRNALKNDQLVLHYQPIVNAESGEIASCEALVRWIHPERGLIPPLQFVPLAEEMGLITKIGEWVLNQACRDATLMPKAMKMAVNVSVQQIKNPSFPLQVVAALNNSGLAPSRLELELTETIMASGDEVVLQSIKQLRDIGVRIALDDFGVGFSSLSCLKDFEFDRIKIDRSFLQNIERSKEAAIFHAIANMGIELGVATTAEGVETAEQLETVMAQGCTEVQGYFFSKPKPIHEVTAFVEAHKVRPKSKMEKKA